MIAPTAPGRKRASQIPPNRGDLAKCPRKYGSRDR